MKNNHLHNRITNEFSQNPKMFDAQASFQLLCHYVALSSPNGLDEIAQSFGVSINTVSRWLTGKSAPHVLARKTTAEHMLKIVKEGDFSISPSVKEFKTALSELFARSAANLTHPKLFQLACNVAHSYDADIDRKVSDEIGISFPTIGRWRVGRSVPHVAVRPMIIKGIGELLNP